MKELEESVKRIKNLNIPVAKPLVDLHNNICYSMKMKNETLDMKHFKKLEQLICNGEDIEIIIKMLETKIVRQISIEYILRLLSLFSIT